MIWLSAKFRIIFAIDRYWIGPWKSCMAVIETREDRRQGARIVAENAEERRVAR